MGRAQLKKPQNLTLPKGNCSATTAATPSAAHLQLASRKPPPERHRHLDGASIRMETNGCPRHRETRNWPAPMNDRQETAILAPINGLRNRPRSFQAAEVLNSTVVTRM